MLCTEPVSGSANGTADPQRTEICRIHTPCISCSNRSMCEALCMVLYVTLRVQMIIIGLVNFITSDVTIWPLSHVKSRCVTIYCWAGNKERSALTVGFSYGQKLTYFYLFIYQYRYTH